MWPWTQGCLPAAAGQCIWAGWWGEVGPWHTLVHLTLHLPVGKLFLPWAFKLGGWGQGCCNLRMGLG